MSHYFFITFYISVTSKNSHICLLTRIKLNFLLWDNTTRKYIWQDPYMKVLWTFYHKCLFLLLKLYLSYYYPFNEIQNTWSQCGRSLLVFFIRRGLVVFKFYARVTCIIQGNSFLLIRIHTLLRETTSKWEVIQPFLQSKCYIKGPSDVSTCSS